MSDISFKNNGKLLAAVTAYYMALADIAHYLCKGDYDLVAVCMAVGIVDRFEIVDIHNGYAQSLSRPVRFPDLSVKLVIKCCVVDQSGHGINLNPVFKACLVFKTFHDQHAVILNKTPDKHGDEKRYHQKHH